MPLDPYFAAQHRAHIRDLAGQYRQRMLHSARLLWANLGRRPARQKAHAERRTRAARAAKQSTSEWKRKNARAWDAKLAARVGIPGPDVPTEDHIVSVTGFPDVRVRVYRPTADAAGPTPAVIAFFGGSFQLGGVDWASEDAQFRSRTADAAVVTIAVDYALAPEHRFPTPVEQGYAVLAWAHENAEELGIDPARIALNGVSSGGNIAAAVALANRRRRQHPVCLQVLEVPTLDLTGRHLDLRPLRMMRVPYVFARRELVSVVTAYLGDRSRARDELASPLRSRSLRGLPPAVILTAEYDVLRGDGVAFAQALREAGVDASAVEYKGAVHDTLDYRAVVPLAERWHRDVVTALRTLHE
ncbi:alpha/beta hydrolase [Microbacterium sp. MPKO10]|uniref:alpha/beta hydrolase n=1 Tax=Microbacterium sp. MPKO10 TaxID=2989818 RepID=UPI0022368E96|nr:alpha/beta hydrolase [Microbacterium sp. MPKO10]MCW4458948.1 alpha/beta hydrolase [Microbacterium sp. MPKO10]